MVCFFFFFNLALLDTDYAANRLGAGDAEGEDSAQEV